MKKIFTKMCLNNWGGISHKVLEFNEYVNLFSGMSGSGKSTVMDAIQVILYGSLSSNFLNKAADDAKNKRSVMSYLRGEQKDGSANRENQDFHSLIALEITDTGTQSVTCIGAFFEVHKNETELKRYSFFSHSGKMPEDQYINAAGGSYTRADLKRLMDDRRNSYSNRTRGDVNRFYASQEAYQSTLNEVILGYIDGSRFRTMQKSSIALKMSNGTGQFIRDYMFPKSEGTIIEKLSEQLGAYRDIKLRIEELKQKIDMLTVIKENGLHLLETQTESIELRAEMKCIDIMDARNKIAAWESEQENLEKELALINEEKAKLEALRDELDTELVEVKAAIKASDLGSKKQHYKDLEDKSHLLADNSAMWRSILHGLRRWGEDEIANDFISNTILEEIQAFSLKETTVALCDSLKEKIKEEKEEVEDLWSNYRDQHKKVVEELNAKKEMIDDIKNNRKSYSEHIRQARTQLEQKLTNLYKKKVPVHVFADLFDIVDSEWKDAVEGRMGSLKLCLITEPQYAHNAAVIFKKMKQFEDVQLINSYAIANKESKVEKNALYEAVSAKEEYVDACLKHYIGRIIKCRSVEELEKVREGVTPDCYSYSNFIFRHLKERDYTTGACIGSKVSKAKLASYEEELKKLESKRDELSRTVNGLQSILKYEDLSQYQSEHLVKFSESQKTLSAVVEEMEKVRQEIKNLEEGEFKQLEEKRKELESRVRANRKELAKNQERLLEKTKVSVRLGTDLNNKRNYLNTCLAGYVANEELEQNVCKMLEKVSGLTLKNKLEGQLNGLMEQEQKQQEQLYQSRNEYIRRYPSCGFTGAEKSNDVYLNQLLDYEKNYKPGYEEEFEKQYGLVYKMLRENVIAKIHGDIKAAQRHKNEINRMLRDTNFADSTYQIKIEAAKNSDGQFYEMLMASELDSKNPEFDGMDGQLSFGDDMFYQKYESKIKLLTDKFMPPVENDERSLSQCRMEMEKYVDYRTYLQFNMYEQVTDEDGNIIRENYVDDMAGRDSGGEGQNPKYVALLAGFAMLYMNQSNRDSKIKLVLLDEAFSKMDQRRSEVCLKYARKLDLQLIVCVPDERLQSLIRNVDCVYGFKREKNQISMMHIDKGRYLSLEEGE